MDTYVVSSTDVLHLEQVVLLHRKANDERAIVSKLVGLDENSLVVNVQMSEREYRDAPERLEEIAITAIGDNAIYRGTVKFHACSPLPTMLWLVNRPETLIFQQCRDFVRIPMNATARVRLSNGRGGFGNYHDRPVLDISGNGIAFVSKTPVILDTKVEFQLEGLPEFSTFFAVGIVKRCLKVVSSKGSVVYHVGVFFGDDISVVQQDKICKAVAQLQREFLAKGQPIK